MTFVDLRESYLFTNKESMVVKYLLQIYKKHSQRHGAFLYQINYPSFKFYWNSKIMSNGVMGAFEVSTPDSLHVADQPGKFDMIAATELNMKMFQYSWLISMLPTIVHEMTHAWQWHRESCLPRSIQKLLYVICAGIPFLRQITLELDVKEAETDAYTFFTELNSDLSARDFYEKIGYKQGIAPEYKNKKLTEEVYTALCYPNSIKLLKYNE